VPTLSLELSPEVMFAFEQYCSEHGLSKSEAVAALLRERLSAKSDKSVFDLCEEAGGIGCFEGPGDLASRHSYYVKKKLREKHALSLERARRPRPPK
jgi:hypothetical protein